MARREYSGGLNYSGGKYAGHAMSDGSYACESPHEEGRDVIVALGKGVHHCFDGDCLSITW